MNPGSIARSGYLTGVLSIATNGYIGTITPVAGDAYPVGVALDGRAGIVTVSAVINAGPDRPDNFLLLEDEFRIYLEDGKGFLILETGAIDIPIPIPDPGIPITNPTAFVRDQSGVTICARSGMIAKPGQLVKDPRSGGWVLPKYVDEYQPEPEKYRTKDRTKGARRPEDGINWIITPVDPDDL